MNRKLWLALILALTLVVIVGLIVVSTQRKTVYSGAVEDFLLPVEEYSWEREFAPEYVMIHFTSAVVEHRDDPLNMDYIRQIFVDYDISVHYIIDREGTVRCYVPEDRVAWHAGKGEWANDEKYTNKMNHYAIGIEIAAIGSQKDMGIYLTEEEYAALDDRFKGFSDAQYDALKLLVEDICARYDIPADRDHVIGHQDYSPSKNDPGELFDWSRILPH
ncbi:MAG: N-acetylmuramoyl-L-alanine amidase [Clostridia bacterium]|nr:N-acetylmuramoyl-L-alanine amidase [Clostridia bacterium]MBR3796083.1 N-acetylmuramoyl-L-alanine amidase [Clostridia bacterium]